LTALKEDVSVTLPCPVVVQRKIGRVFWHIKIFFKILKILKFTNLIYVNGLIFESVGAAWLRGKKIIVRIAGDQVWERAVRNGWTKKNILDFQKGKSNLKIKLLKIIRRLVIVKAYKVIAPSHFLAGIIESWGIEKERIVVIRNPYSPVPLESFEFPPNVRDKFIVATGGRLLPWKGVDMVIRSIADIKNSYLFIVGDGPESEKLKRQVEDLNITDRVYFTGSLSRSRLLYLLSRSNCFVLNSKYEGLSHIILEAMAAGCPVIASNCGGNPEIIKHKENGFLIDPDNKDALKRYLIELKADPRLGAVLKKNGENTISENFHPEIKYQETLGVLLE
jgi:glycosyltransferase involved in cell wall biosynthesis